MHQREYPDLRHLKFYTEFVIPSKMGRLVESFEWRTTNDRQLLLSKISFLKISMTYPYPELQNLNQLWVSPTSYHSILGRYLSKDGNSLIPTKLDAAYWDMIPSYTYARCPLCSSLFSSPIDTYSLAGWDGTHTGLSKQPYAMVREGTRDEQRCEHVVSIQKFINLHDQAPYEKTYFHNQTGEVPLITPWCLHADLASYAVLHALPICVTKDDIFVPAYTFFCLTYFSADPRETIRRHYASEWQRGHGDSEFFPAELSKPSNHKSAALLYDLDFWSASGQLGILDYHNPNLPLIIGAGTKVSTVYQDIRGLKRGYTWRNGRKSLHVEF